MKRFPEDFDVAEVLPSGGSVMGVDAGGEAIAVPTALIVSPAAMKALPDNLLGFRNADGDMIGKIDLNEAFTGYAGDMTKGAGRWIIGTRTPSGDDSALLIARDVEGDTHSHGVRDESRIKGTADGNAYAGFDFVASLIGTVAYDHWRGYQARGIWAGSGSLSEYNSFGSTPVIQAGSGAVTYLYDLHVAQGQIDGTVANRIAIKIDPLAGATTNVAIFAENMSYLLADLQIAGDLTGVEKLIASGQCEVGSLHLVGTGISSYAAGGGLFLANEYCASGYAAIQAYTDATGTPIGFALQPNGGQVLIGNAGIPVTGALLEVDGSASISGNLAGVTAGFTGNLSCGAAISATGAISAGTTVTGAAVSGVGLLAAYRSGGATVIYDEGVVGHLRSYSDGSGTPKPIRINIQPGATVELGMPTYADEAAATAAGLAQNTIYVTSTGAVRAKL